MDILKYIEALEKFLKIMHKLPDTLSEGACEAFADICSILNIGCIKTVVFDKENVNHLTTNPSTILFGSEYPDNRTPIEKRYETVDGRSIAYNIFHSAEDIPWTAEEKEKIDLFCDTLFDYNSRSKAFKTASMLTFYDFDIKVHNLKFFYRFINETVQKRNVGSYAAVRFNMKQYTVINQRIGRPNGTKLLAKFINYIESTFQEDETICRIGGDNFICLVKKENLMGLLDKLMGTDICMEELNGEVVHLAASVGVFNIPSEYTVIFHGEIMDSVSTALQIAKDNYKPEIVYFNQELLAVKKKQNFRNIFNYKHWIKY